MSAEGGVFRSWWWRFPLFCAGIAFLVALALFFAGYGFLLSQTRMNEGNVECRYLTLKGVLVSEQVVWAGCRFLGRSGEMEGVQPMPILI